VQRFKTVSMDRFTTCSVIIYKQFNNDSGAEVCCIPFFIGILFLIASDIYLSLRQGKEHRMENGKNRNNQQFQDEMVNQIIDKIYRKIEMKFDDLLLRLISVKENDSKQGDYTIAEIARITGCGKNKAYENTYYGEYRNGITRLIRKEIFDYRRAQGLNICKGE